MAGKNNSKKLGPELDPKLVEAWNAWCIDNGLMKGNALAAALQAFTALPETLRTLAVKGAWDEFSWVLGAERTAEQETKVLVGIRKALQRPLRFPKGSPEKKSATE